MIIENVTPSQPPVALLPLINTKMLACFTLGSKPSSHSGQVSGQQRKKEPEAALGVSPQAPLQP